VQVVDIEESSETESELSDEELDFKQPPQIENQEETQLTEANFRFKDKEE
jgi:hypothetical protein